MRTTLLLLALAACEGVGTVRIEDDGAPDSDDATDETEAGGNHGGNGDNGGNGGNGDHGGPTDTDDGGPVDTDDGGQGGADPFDPAPLAWNGETVLEFVKFQGGSCKLRTTEAGEQVYGPGYLQMERACPTCQRVFVVPVELRGLCLTTLSSPTTWYRGLEFRGGGKVKVWRLRQSGTKWTAEPLADGTLTGDELTYAYTSTEIGYKRVDVTATITLE